MDEQRQPKRHTQFSRATRSKRILDRLREGWAYDEVAREEALTERRVRQIVAEYLKDRDAVESVTHAHMQIDRLGWAMRVAAEAMGEGDVRAIGPFIKAIDRLDRYQALARRTGTQPNTLEEDLEKKKTLRWSGRSSRGCKAQARPATRFRRTRPNPAGQAPGRRWAQAAIPPPNVEPPTSPGWREAGFFRLGLTVSHCWAGIRAAG